MFAIQASNLSMAEYMQILTSGHNAAMFGGSRFGNLAFSCNVRVSNSMAQSFIGGS
jgi:hypothetical protein